MGKPQGLCNTSGITGAQCHPKSFGVSGAGTWRRQCNVPCRWDAMLSACGHPQSRTKHRSFPRLLLEVNTAQSSGARTRGAMWRSDLEEHMGRSQQLSDHSLSNH